MEATRERKVAKRGRRIREKALIALALVMVFAVLTVTVPASGATISTQATVTEDETADQPYPGRLKKHPGAPAGTNTEESEGSTDASEARAQALERQKERVNRIIDRAQSFLNKAKDRLAGAKRIDEEKKNEIIAAIDSGLASLEAKKAEVEAVADRAELREIAKAVHAEWREIRFSIRSLVRAALEARISAVLAKADEISATIQEKLAKVEDENDKALLEDKLNRFNSHIADAKDYFTRAQETFEAAKNDQSKAGFAESRSYIRKTLTALKKAHGVLKSIKGLSKSR